MAMPVWVLLIWKGKRKKKNEAIQIERERDRERISGSLFEGGTDGRRQGKRGVEGGQISATEKKQRDGRKGKDEREER